LTGVNDDLPMIVTPTWRACVIAPGLIASLSLFWIVGSLRDMETSIGELVLPLGMGFLVLLYIKNQTIRLDETEITQGFSPFRTRISYGMIASVGREMRSFKGASTEMLVISERESARRVRFPVINFDYGELIQVIRLIATRAPQARLDAVSSSLYPVHC
jgi:hypothetical protein